jgi:excisionase family DNA binding protein
MSAVVPASQISAKNGKKPADLPRLALSVAEAAEVLGVSPDFFAEHIARELRCVRRGRKRLYAVRELERWLDRSASLAIE